MIKLAVLDWYQKVRDTMDKKIPVSSYVNVADLDAIIVTATEGGSNYWADMRRYDHSAFDDSLSHHTGVTVEYRENEPDCATLPGWHKVNRDLVLRGLQVIAEKYPHLFASFLKSGGSNAEPGDYAPDADLSDAIVQAGIFGELVYG